MDAITKSFLKEFVDSKNYNSLPLSDQFEMFANFCITNKEYDSVSFDEKEISTGKNTQGIDGIGIIVNNKLCNSIQEIEELIELNRILTVSFIIIQSKTSNKFEGAQIENMFRWTKTFFNEQSNLFVTNEMQNFIEMKEYIYSNSKYMKDRNPICSIYFCSTGKWTDDPNLVKITEENIKELEDLNLFEKVSGPGDNITITNYQIVNGCQTSNVLFENRNVPNIDNMHIPLKIIVTENADIKSRITRATNNQTAVDAVELEALTEFQRNLEYYYQALPQGELKLYYERRTNQFKSSDIPMNRIINRETQIKVYSAMFLDKPHLVAGYYGKLIKDMGDDIFNNDHDYLPYYTSALTYYVIENFYNTGKLDKNSRRFRHQIILIFRFLVVPFNPPSSKDKKKIEIYCLKIIDVLKNETSAIERFKEAIAFLRSDTLNLDFKDRKTVERKTTTDIILNGLIQKYTV